MIQITELLEYDHTLLLHFVHSMFSYHAITPHPHYTHHHYPTYVNSEAYKLISSFPENFLHKMEPSKMKSYCTLCCWIVPYKLMRIDSGSNKNIFTYGALVEFDNKVT